MAIRIMQIELNQAANKFHPRLKYDRAMRFSVVDIYGNISIFDDI